ncbi:MAG: ABC-three component system middle component 6 [Candidatus Heimdallarchaeaceae archaeon]
MILPTKHVSIMNCLLNIGATILQRIDGDRTVTELWNEVKVLEEVKTFERFTLAVAFLYMLGAIEFKDGLLRRVVNDQ